MKGILYLLPVPLGETSPELVVPEYNSRILNTIDEFIVEDLRTARRHIKLMGMKQPIENLLFHELGKHSDPDQYSSYLANALTGKNIGLLSDAGCPGVADPGAEIVRIAHEYQIRVVPLTGPSSILLALMASGSNGQQFCFHGYLPKERSERVRKIKELEKQTLLHKQTQIFIETPFRNDHMMEDLLRECKDQTLLCVAADITLPSEFIQTRSITAWKKNKPSLHKRPAIFIFCC
jgi:16S rRNA (cytidine1402-2'-O)-methyltransferase